MKRILLPLDFSDVTEAAVRMAEISAEAFRAKVYLLYVSVMRPGVLTCDEAIALAQASSEHEEGELEVLLNRF